MKKILILVGVGLVVALITGVYKLPEPPQAQEEPSGIEVYAANTCFTLDESLNFCIPVKSIYNPVIFGNVREANSDIQFMHILESDALNRPASVCISTYVNDVAVSLDSAFSTVLCQRNSTDTEQDYQLIRCGETRVEGVRLYQKISIRGGDVCSIMHYFMENDFSTTVYEVKVGGFPNEMDSLKALAETIALSVRFKSRNS
ncbi:MAG: hypothetical protein ACKORE_02335 [Bacteroidota bacterium]